MDKNVVVFSGTSDSICVIDLLLKNNYSVIASVATDEGEKMLSNIKGITINNSRLDSIGMIEFFKNKNIYAVVDSSHPYAENVSKTAIEVCDCLNIKYIRYERPSENASKNCIFVKNYAEAVSFINKIEGNILVTTGVNNIESYKAVSNFENRIFARVLNNKNSFGKARSIGLPNENILTGNGIYGIKENIDVIKNYNIKALVTKDSGKAGGFVEKVNACEHFGIPMIVIEKPNVDYKNKTENIYDIIKMLED